MWESILPSVVSGGGALIGFGLNAHNQERINNKNADLQREFAQNSIQWRVKDAEAAGIHPLAALGAGGYQAAPSYAGADNGLAEVGQKLSQGLKDLFDERSRLENESLALDNEKKKKELAAMGQGVSALFQNPTNPNAILQTPNNPSSLPNPLVNSHDLNTMQLGKGVNISAYPSDDGGKPRYFLQFDQDTIGGEMVSNGSIWDMPITQPMQIERLLDHVSVAEKIARSKGILKNNERFKPSIRPDGVILQIVTIEDPQKYKKRINEMQDRSGFGSVRDYLKQHSR